MYNHFPIFSSERVYLIACVRACVRFATSEPITLGAADAFYIILIYRLAAIQIDLDRISLYAQNKLIAKHGLKGRTLVQEWSISGHGFSKFFLMFYFQKSP